MACGRLEQGYGRKSRNTVSLVVHLDGQVAKFRAEEGDSTESSQIILGLLLMKMVLLSFSLLVSLQLSQLLSPQLSQLLILSWSLLQVSGEASPVARQPAKSSDRVSIQSA